MFKFIVNVHANLHQSLPSSKLVPIYKGKGDVLECSLSQGIKLLEHGMKVADRVLERRLRQAVVIDKMQFGFRPFAQVLL